MLIVQICFHLAAIDYDKFTDFMVVYNLANAMALFMSTNHYSWDECNATVHRLDNIHLHWIVQIP